MNPGKGLDLYVLVGPRGIMYALSPSAVGAVSEVRTGVMDLTTELHAGGPYRWAGNMDTIRLTGLLRGDE
jgi:hypothetical protein